MGSVTLFHVNSKFKKKFSSTQTVRYSVTISETGCRKLLELDSLFQKKKKKKGRERGLQGLWPTGLNDAIKSFRICT